MRFCLANGITIWQTLARWKIKNFGSKSKIRGLPILWGVGGLCGGVVLLLGDLTEFTVVSNLGLLGSKVTKGIFVSVWENLSFVSEGIRDHMGILNKELMNCVFRDVSEKNDDVVTLSSLLEFPSSMQHFLFNGRFVWVGEPILQIFRQLFSWRDLFFNGKEFSFNEKMFAFREWNYIFDKWWNNLWRTIIFLFDKSIFCCFSGLDLAWSVICHEIKDGRGGKQECACSLKCFPSQLKIFLANK